MPRKIEPVNLFGEWQIIVILFAETLGCCTCLSEYIFQSCLHFVSICRQLKFNALALVDVLSVPLLNQFLLVLGVCKIYKNQ